MSVAGGDHASWCMRLENLRANQRGSHLDPPLECNPSRAYPRDVSRDGHSRMVKRAMYWVLQKNLFDERGYGELISAIERFGFPHGFHDSFESHVVPEVEILPPERVIVMGTVGLCRIAKERGWRPGSFLNENFDFEVQRQHWGDEMLNAHALVCAFGDLPEQLRPFFLRPVHDTKTLNGMVLDWAEYLDLRSRIERGEKHPRSSLDLDTPVVVASKKAIQREWRLWIVDGEVVTQSLYKVNGKALVTEDVPPEVVRYGREIAKRWSPARAYVLDVAGTADGYRVIEVNNINSAGFYAASTTAIVAALASLL